MQSGVRARGLQFPVENGASAPLFLFCFGVFALVNFFVVCFLFVGACGSSFSVGFNLLTFDTKINIISSN
jgi:hypothetical protein